LNIINSINKTIKSNYFNKLFNNFYFNNILSDKNINEFEFNIDELNENLCIFKQDILKGYENYLNYKINSNLNIFNIENQDYITLTFNTIGLSILQKIFKCDDMPKKIKVILMCNSIYFSQQEKGRVLLKKFFDTAEILKSKFNITIIFVDIKNVILNEYFLEDIDILFFGERKADSGFRTFIFNTKTSKADILLDMNEDLFNKFLEDASNIYNIKKIKYKDVYFLTLQLYRNIDRIIQIFKDKTKIICKVELTIEGTMYDLSWALICLILHLTNLKLDCKIKYLLPDNLKLTYYLIANNIYFYNRPIGYYLNNFRYVYKNKNKLDIFYDNENFNNMNFKELFKDIHFYTIELDNIFYLRDLRENSELNIFNIENLLNSDINILDVEELLLDYVSDIITLKKHIPLYKTNNKSILQEQISSYIDLNTIKSLETFRNIDILFLMYYFDFIENKRDGATELPTLEQVINNIMNSFKQIFVQKGLFVEQDDIFFIKDRNEKLYLTAIDKDLISLTSRLKLKQDFKIDFDIIDFIGILCSVFNLNLNCNDISQLEEQNLKSLNNSLNTIFKNYNNINTLFHKFTSEAGKGGNVDDISYNIIGELSPKNKHLNEVKWFNNTVLEYKAIIKYSNCIETLEQYNRYLYEIYLTLLYIRRKNCTKKLQQPFMKYKSLLKDLISPSLELNSTNNYLTVNLGLKYKL